MKRLKLDLYGIAHGGDFMGTPVVTHPSSGMMMSVYSLPEGSRIGIEYFKEFHSDGNLSKGEITVDGKSVRLDDVTDKYWQNVLDCLRYGGYEPVFIDDLETYKKGITNIIQSANAGKRKLKLTKPDEFSLSAVGEYIFIVEREQKMLEAISRERPDAVIIGSGHADYFYLNPSLLRKHGISIRSYSKESPPPGFLLDWGHDVINTFDLNPSVSSSIFSERQMVVRRMLAATQGRIIPEKKPKYIGTWDLGCEPNGLFEVYPMFNKSKVDVKGRIEDSIGTADFSGRITDKEVDFVKIYHPDAQSLGGSGEPIHYKGLGSDGSFEGVFTTGSKKTEGGFRMRRFDSNL